MLQMYWYSQTIKYTRIRRNNKKEKCTHPNNKQETYTLQYYNTMFTRNNNKISVYGTLITKTQVMSQQYTSWVHVAIIYT